MYVSFFMNKSCKNINTWYYWLMDSFDFLKKLVIRGDDSQKLFPIFLDDFPAWISKTVAVYAFNLNQDSRLYLVKAKKDLAYDQLVNIVSLIEKKLGGFAILIADDLNPKYRALFVKNNVPFIYRDKSLFAPRLGIKLFDYKEPRQLKAKLIEESVRPFELKLLAGYLTGYISKESFNLNQIESILEKNNYKCSKAKLAQAINHLIDLEFMDAKGTGPNRLVIFRGRQEVWAKLKETPLKSFSKSIESYYMIDDDFIYSGETALAYCSDLAEPKIKHIAVTNQEFQKIQKGVPVGDFGNPLYVCDVLKESPSLFAKNNKFLNPVELYFLMRSNSDERVQIALDQMLSDQLLKE